MAAAAARKGVTGMRIGQVILLGVGSVALAGMLWLVHEVKRPPRTAGRPDESRAETSPLTDVAGQPRRPVALPTSPPREPTAAAAELSGQDSGQNTAARSPYGPSWIPDPARRPLQTQPMAGPGTPVPPDPFKPPAQPDPSRGGRR